jgi:hypothetical protein
VTAAEQTLLGEEAARFYTDKDTVHGRRPDVIYKVSRTGNGFELQFGILQVSTGEIRPSYVVRLNRLQASIYSSLLRCRCRSRDIIGVPEAGEDVYNVIADSFSLLVAPGAYVMTIGAYERSTRRWEQIGQVILSDGECDQLSALLAGASA